MLTGLGIRPELFAPVLAERPAVGFLEAHSENYFARSPARAALLQCREHYPVSLHGVGLSLGRADNLDYEHLQMLAALVAEVDPLYVSEHLAWSAFGKIHIPDLLPLPLNKQTLDVMCEHVDLLQSTLRRQIFVENPSSYLLFEHAQYSEAELLNLLTARTGCGLLLDLNNVWVSSQNVGRDANEYLAQLRPDSIKQLHLAGHSQVDTHNGVVLIDSHNEPVADEVWALYKNVIAQHGALPTLLEWDSDYPPLEFLLAQCQQADQIVANCQVQPVDNSSEIKPNQTPAEPAEAHTELAALQFGMLQQILALDEELVGAAPEFGARLRIYQENVLGAVHDYMRELYPAVRGVVGADYFRQMVQLTLQLEPPRKGDINQYGREFVNVLPEMPGSADLPYLGDLMTYEWALHKAYCGAFDNSLDPHEYSREQLLGMPLRLNQSVTVIDSHYPILEIHRQSLPNHTASVEINLNQSQDAMLVFKREHEVITRELDQHELLFFDQLTRAIDLREVIDVVGGSTPADTVSTLLAMLFENRLLDAPARQYH